MSEVNVGGGDPSGVPLPPGVQGPGATPETGEVPAGQPTGISGESSLTQAMGGWDLTSNDLPPINQGSFQMIATLLKGMVAQSIAGAAIANTQMITELSEQQEKKLEQLLGLSPDDLSGNNTSTLLDCLDCSQDLTYAALQGNTFAVLLLSANTGKPVQEILDALEEVRTELGLESGMSLEEILDKMFKNMELSILSQIINTLFGDSDPDTAGIQHDAAYLAAERAAQEAEDEAIQDDRIEDMVEKDAQLSELKGDQLEAAQNIMKAQLQMILLQAAQFMARTAMPTENITEEKLNGFNGDVDGKIEVLREHLNELLGEHPELAQLTMGLQNYVENPAQIQKFAETLMHSCSSLASTIIGGANGGTVQLPIIG